MYCMIRDYSRIRLKFKWISMVVLFGRFLHLLVPLLLFFAYLILFLSFAIGDFIVLLVSLSIFSTQNNFMRACSYVSCIIRWYQFENKNFPFLEAFLKKNFDNLLAMWWCLCVDFNLRYEFYLYLSTFKL